jgi:hypothetical protein
MLGVFSPRRSRFNRRVAPRPGPLGEAAPPPSAVQCFGQALCSVLIELRFVPAQTLADAALQQRLVSRETTHGVIGFNDSTRSTGLCPRNRDARTILLQDPFQAILIIGCFMTALRSSSLRLGTF